MLQKKNPKLYEAYDKRGVCHMKLGNFREALLDFKETLRLQPNRKSAQANLEILYNEIILVCI